MKRELVKDLLILLAGIISGFGFYAMEEGKFGILTSCSIMLILVVVILLFSMSSLE